MKALLLSLCLVGFCGLAAVSARAQSPKALLLFGGKDHKTFLGCLNCMHTSPLSVCNEYGKFGSEYNIASIWDEYGDFGSSYSVDSPWDSYSTDAPIIVDKDGNSYGYFSVNTFILDRTRIPWLVKVLELEDSNDDLDKTKELLCGE